MRKVLIFPLIFLLMGGPALAQTATNEVTPSNVITAPSAAPVIVKQPTAETVVVKTPAVESGPIKFRDVPDDHWAASSVYDLVNMGVTQGYPDGTFRGNNYITRYETAMFLSKLANSVGQNSDDVDVAMEKLKDDLRAEIRSLRADIAELKQTPTEGEEKPISGSFTTDLMFGNLIAGNTGVAGENAPVGPIVRYRLMTTFAKTLSDDANLKINLDTMDSGFGGGSSDLSTNILDVEGDMKLNLGLEAPVDVIVTSGPGPVVHTEEAVSGFVSPEYVARSEIGVVYVRPWNSFTLSSKFYGIDTSLGYIARHLSAFGEVDVNQINATFGYNFPGMFFIMPFKLNTSVDYLSSTPQATPPGPIDTKVTFDFSYLLTQKLKSTVIYSTGKGDAPHNSMFGLTFDLLDMWDSGTTISILYKKVGGQYLYEDAALYEDLFAGLDVFNRYIGDGYGNGVVDLGAKINQVITETVSLYTKSDWRLAADNSYGRDYPECSLVIEGGVDWNLATDSMLEASYRVESVPSQADQSTDLTQISMAFKF